MNQCSPNLASKITAVTNKTLRSENNDIKLGFLLGITNPASNAGHDGTDDPPVIEQMIGVMRKSSVLKQLFVVVVVVAPMVCARPCRSVCPDGILKP